MNGCVTWHSWLIIIIGYLDNLNLKLQGSSKLFTTLCNDVASFKMKEATLGYLLIHYLKQDWEVSTLS